MRLAACRAKGMIGSHKMTPRTGVEPATPPRHKQVMNSCWAFGSYQNLSAGTEHERRIQAKRRGNRKSYELISKRRCLLSVKSNSLRNIAAVATMKAVVAGKLMTEESPNYSIADDLDTDGDMSRDADPMTEFLTYRSHVRAGVKKWLFDVLCG